MTLLFYASGKCAFIHIPKTGGTSIKAALGLATGYIQGSRFGTGTSNANYPQSAVGTGLPGFRMSFGIQF